MFSLISLIIGTTNEKRRYEFGYTDPLLIAFPAVLCFISLGGLVYAVVVWRKEDMVKPGGGFNGRKGVDGTEGGIPMV